MGSKNSIQWTPEMEEAIKSRYHVDGPTKLGKEFGLSYLHVLYKARELGIGPTRAKPFKTWTAEMLEKIRIRYEKEGGDELAKEFGCTLGTLRKRASRMGIHTIAGHARAGKEKAKKNNSCDIHYFDTWSPNMAYVLGFLFADGTMNKKKTGVGAIQKASDSEILEFICKEVKLKKGLKFIPKHVDCYGVTCKDAYCISINSTVVAAKLVELGLMPRKTFENHPFPNVPDEMFPHFVRGYLDGDGTTCVTRRSVCCVSFVGAVKFITGLRDALVRLAGMSFKGLGVRHGKTADYAYVTWTSGSDIRLFRKYAYPEGFEYCLKRKKKNLDDWLSIGHRENKIHRRWTENEINILMEQYEEIGPAKIGRLIGRDTGTVCNKAKELKL